MVVGFGNSLDGDIIDCVLSHQQLAFDHPQLKGQNPLEPPDRPKAHKAYPNSMDSENYQSWSLSEKVGSFTIVFLLFANPVFLYFLSRSKESKAVDTESLCVLPGKFVWAIRIDLHILDNGGNLVDIANIAALAALMTF
ncbi:uncharacterized protein LOC133825245 [Humulus lupulus]|uniref:uncharacterized protein LOC133825245 n=1 Tax=Humulus lupulus TaxID=3486 RepID=UPI002B409E42|nr:uncharacterized protein LOC133825245 [Humulus lupulus]